MRLLYETAPYGWAMPRRRTGAPTGRPPLDRKRHTYGPTLELALVEELKERAASLGLSLSRYCDAVLAMAHGFVSPYLPDLDGYLAVPGWELRSYAEAAIHAQHGVQRIGPVQRVYVRADEPLSLDVDNRCDLLDMSYADYLRAILRVAVGYPIDGSGQVEQSELQLGEVAS